MHAYCLFCQTQRCGLIADFIQRMYGYRCISPRVIQRKWVRGTPTEEAHDWLPGYIFVYTREPIRPFFSIHGIIRWLGRQELQGQDRAFAEMILRRDGVLGAVPLAQVGDRCRVEDPLWQGMNGTVVKLDRGRRRCCLEFEFDHITRRVWVGYELIQTEKKTG